MVQDVSFHSPVAYNNHLPKVGEPFISSKNAGIVPYSADHAALLAHLEVDGHVNRYIQVETTSVLSDEGRSRAGETITYHIDHDAGLFFIFFLPNNDWRNHDILTAYHDQFVHKREVKLLFVNNSLLRSGVRWQNVQNILGCKRTSVSPRDRLTILDYVDTYGRVDIGECASLCTSADDAIAAIFAMIAEGSLLVDLGQRLTLRSILTCCRQENEPRDLAYIINQKSLEVTLTQVTTPIFFSLHDQTSRPITTSTDNKLRLGSQRMAFPLR
jgi:hypothetical protein